MRYSIVDPFEQAFFAMVHLPYLQPFEDVNKRVSRLAANIPFIKGNLSPLSFLDVAARDYLEATLAVYELTEIEPLRDLFVWAYERSCQRYTQMRDALPAPDPVRFRNREALTQIVNAIVRDELPIDDASIRPIAARLAHVRRCRTTYRDGLRGAAWPARRQHRSLSAPAQRVSALARASSRRRPPVT